MRAPSELNSARGSGIDVCFRSRMRWEPARVELLVEIHQAKRQGRSYHVVQYGQRPCFLEKRNCAKHEQGETIKRDEKTKSFHFPLPPQSNGLPRYPRGGVYRIYAVSTVIPIVLRIAYYELQIKPTKNQHFCCFYVLSYEFND